jgi:uncharacterized protein YuzE/uncharacterized protein with HEPN domain
MTVRIGEHEFDHASYDEEADVLYLRHGSDRAAATTFGTPEGHAVRLNEHGEVIGITLVNARWVIERDGVLVVTVPERIGSTAEDLEPALQAVASDGDRRDVFISHATEDKDAIARPLAEELRSRGVSVWFDEYEVGLGDSLRRKIGDGLRHSRAGVVILSPNFFAKEWTQYELDGLTARQIAGEENVILPVWHDVGIDEVREYSAPLADLVAARSASGVATVAENILRVLNRLAAGDRPQAALSGKASTGGSIAGFADATEGRRARQRQQNDAQVPAAAERLVAALSDTDEDVRYEAMSALRDRLTPELLPVIEPLLDDRDNYIRRLAVEYYAAVTGQEGTDKIVAALSDTDEDVRYEAMSALRDRLTPELLPVIEPLLDDRDNYIRRLAVEYYAAVTGRR